MDELEPRDLAAWEAPELPADFEDRVMARLADAPPSEAPTPPRARRGWVVAAAVTAVAAALVLALGSPTSETPTPAPESEPTSGQVADARVPTTFELAPGVRAVAQRGSTISWETKPEGIAVQQVKGQVDYEVQPGTPLRVHTKAGAIDVTGTRFSVEVHAMSDAFSPRMRTLVPAGLAVAAAAVAVVVVQQGSVEASNEHGSARVEAGSHAVMSDRSAPRGESESQLADAAPVAAPSPSRKSRASAKERRDFQAKRAKIEAALKQRARMQTRDSAPAEPEPEAPRPELKTKIEGKLDKDYIRERVREDLVPLAIECYNSVLEVDPEFGGRLVLEFDILGDEDVGGIVDDVQPGAGTDPMPPDFVECMSESMMTVTMPPPEGGGRVHVTYPLLFEPE